MENFWHILFSFLIGGGLCAVIVLLCFGYMKSKAERDFEAKWEKDASGNWIRKVRSDATESGKKNTVVDRPNREGENYREEEPMNQTTGKEYVVINVRTSDEVLAEEFFKSQLNDPTEPGTDEFVKSALKANYWIIDSNGNLRVEMSYQVPDIKIDEGATLLHVSVTRSQRKMLAGLLTRVTGK